MVIRLWEEPQGRQPAEREARDTRSGPNSQAPTVLRKVASTNRESPRASASPTRGATHGDGATQRARRTARPQNVKTYWVHNADHSCNERGM
eukprot:2094944-Pleurochrysis_carterae.AAC.1